MSLADLVRDYIALRDAATGQEAASEALLDEIDLPQLWRRELHNLADVIAMLELVHLEGWNCGCHPDDAAAPRDAIMSVVRYLEAMETSARSAQ